LRHAQRGYLDSLLRELKISPSSQALVFSRTSFQRDRISPTRPRAIYFNDDTYVGYVPGGDVIEIASSDPRLGTTFYTLDQSGKAKITRQTDSCLGCHGESMTRDIPGLLVRSVFADSDGQPILSAGTFLTTHESPLSERWGGWYVTGSTGSQPHMGNTQWREREGKEPERLKDPPAPAPASSPNPASAPARAPASLPKCVRTDDYLTPHSDVVALMVLEHQVECHNRITRAAHGTLRALRDEKVISDALGETSQPGKHSDSTIDRIKGSCEPLVEYLLFAKEAPLTEPVTGSSGFAAEFAAGGPRDSAGRSLRQLDLRTRLFRYPCSYLIYSAAFDKLPAEARQYVYQRLREILRGSEKSKTFEHLTPALRSDIAAILQETKPQLKEAWTAP
jgi:hypothetical protein